MDELEAKVALPAAASIPALDGLLDDAVADRPERLELTASYHDTPDLDLARAGATIRHRQDAWQVKQPVERSADGRVRRAEHTFPGGPATVPEEALGLVRALVRGRELGVVAPLRVRRDRVRLRRGGEVAVSLDVDDVEVGGSRAPRRFREVELAAGPGGTGADVERCVAGLLAAGGRRAPNEPKLYPALGDPARAPAEHHLLARTPDPGEPVGDRLAAAIGRATASLIDADVAVRAGAPPAALAEAAGALRGVLEACAAPLESSWLDRHLSWLGALDEAAGALADRHGGLALARLDPALDGTGFAEAAQSWARSPAPHLAAVLDRSVYRSGLEALLEAARGAPLAGDTTDWELLRSARAQARSWRDAPATDRRRRRSLARLAGALEVTAAESRALSELRGVLAALDDARQADALAVMASDLAAAAEDPRSAFVARAISGRADRRARTSARRARRRWVRTDALALRRPAPA